MVTLIYIRLKKCREWYLIENIFKVKNNIISLEYTFSKEQLIIYD